VKISKEYVVLTVAGIGEAGTESTRDQSRFYNMLYISTMAVLLPERLI